MYKPTPPKDAATVLLLKPADPFNIFMVKRHGKSRFMGGLYVYPGGKRDDADGSLQMENFCTGITAKNAARVLGNDIDPYEALGHFVAAVRETFEEAGVLLATHTSGQPVNSNDPTIQETRKALQAGDCTMLDVVKELDLRLALGRLRYLAHWITPPAEPRRFSARFFLCEVEPDQAADHDRIETTDSFWIAPKDALRDYGEGKFMTAPPTLRVLEQMATFNSLQEAMASAEHSPQIPNAPRFAKDGTTTCLVLPGDPLHPTEPGNTKSRFELRDNRWFTVMNS